MEKEESSKALGPTQSGVMSNQSNCSIGNRTLLIRRPDIECCDFLDCGGMLTAPTGSIMSPAFKGQYPSNLECIWLIHLPRERVQLTFSDFNTQQSYDRVEIFHGAKSTNGRLVNLSGVLLPHGFFVTNEYMYVRFTSSAQNDQSYYGFRALYEKYMY
jgi:hypothetical protein